jgi:cytochrome c oxidase subunit 3
MRTVRLEQLNPEPQKDGNGHGHFASRDQSQPSLIHPIQRALLSAETTLIGALLAAVVIYHQWYPDQFSWGQKFLNFRLAAVGLAGLLAAAFALKLATGRLSGTRRWLVLALLAIAFAGGSFFVGARSVEYARKWQHRLMPGKFYHPSRKYVARVMGRPVAVPRAADQEDDSALASASKPAGHGDAENGKQLFGMTCIACHGPTGAGIPNLGANLRESKFVSEQTDDGLVNFIKQGRQPGDPKTVLNLVMPPKGGNPTLDDAGLRDVVAFLRTVQSQAKQTASATGDDKKAAAPAKEEPVLVEPKTIISAAVFGPPGFAGPSKPKIEDTDGPVTPPAHAGDFFGVFFLLTGLHLAHVLLALLLILWVAWRVVRSGQPASVLPSVQFTRQVWKIAAWTGLLLMPLFYALT